ncbi:hypothetical protein A2Z33_06020 [Candidatus Gottesmanbacteria bacterium RBG_16_52_11]|uniref:DUF1697 domain-containing protein n=1 Tax=Candidatus Gottesmanbacteria bacterium RBG_16_52_11 TaxID=1798374 RepID=A0A1F5YXH6_9BACT|nr:MAG: hypothetical protein A2Z33_06020 [Candidatus Gottesmanbacteria bacterium RBG_16_52_11]
MTNYIALLRGINVGGKNIIRMADLKTCFEGLGFGKVTTFIQSGNVLFATSGKTPEKLVTTIERALDKTFNYKSTVLVRSASDIAGVLTDVPRDWKTRTDLRCYVAFVKPPVTVAEVIREIPVKAGIDTISAGKGAVYMTTVLSGLTKSGLNKIIGKNIYRLITIRNYSTMKKIAALMNND